MSQGASCGRQRFCSVQQRLSAFEALCVIRVAEPVHSNTRPGVAGVNESALSHIDANVRVARTQCVEEDQISGQRFTSDGARLAGQICCRALDSDAYGRSVDM